MSERPIHEMEAVWQKTWEDLGVYRASHPHDPSTKFYGLIEFPYPSGDGLHVGHPRSYVALDVFTRKKRMEGRNVLYPIGWDAFGLPTENYAIKNKIRPADATKKNVENFTRQIKMLGIGFDWSREINTTDEAYYRWTQWQFLQFVKAGLAYKAKTMINWCPKDKIGLANEEVIGGACERCGTPVEKREKEQWMLRMSAYADRLLSDLNHVDYLDKVKTQQIHWIGKSTGARITFQLTGPIISADALSVAPAEAGAQPRSSGLDSNLRWNDIEVFTTRPDTIFGATFLALSPELAQTWLDVGWQADEKIKKYVREALRKSETERSAEGGVKTGVDAGIRAQHPVTGEQIPVWIADYVLGGYGSGAIMAVPAHDERDFAFAQAYDLPIKQVVAPFFVQKDNPPREGKPMKRRKTIHAIVRRPSDGKFLLLQWKGAVWEGREPRTFLIGGVEENEDLVGAAQREILEETGYAHTRYVRTLPFEIHTQYFAAHKDENRQADIHVLVFELEDETRVPVQPEEEKKHDVLWVDAGEVPSFVNIADGPFVWKSYTEEVGAYTEEGVMVHSDFLNDLTVEEAKKKIVAWLEEKGVGETSVTYRLRDWIFSRQRYWGEPIPLVYCEDCAKKKQKVLLIHGFESSADLNWFPSMKRRLEQEGYEVMVPSLPASDKPRLEDWLKALAPLMERLGADDVVVGHSLGARAAMHLLVKQKKKIGHLYLVTPALFSDDYDWKRAAEDWEGSDVETFQAFVKTPISWEETGAYATSKTVIFSDDDPFIAPHTHATIPEGWFIRQWSGYGHMEGARYPELEACILGSKGTGWISVPEEHLPLTLPDVPAYELTDTGESPLANMTDWVQTTCPQCHGPARRETDTMPNWAGSSWYFLRYADPHNDQRFASPEALKYWMPVDLYNGGMEHTTLHLLYSRFWHKFLWDMGYVPHEVGSEPYRARRSHGLILAEGGEKMSKSKGNVVNPDDVVKKYGADVFRIYEMFMGPFDQPVPWDTNGIEGVRRFLDKVWNLFALRSVDPLSQQARDKNDPKEGRLETLYHQTVKKITDGIDRLQFNTCVSQLMIMMNAFQDAGFVPADMREGTLKLLAPFAPHLAEELWSKGGGKGSIHVATWPSYDEAKLQAATFELIIQVDGKLRDKITVGSEIDEAEARRIALSSPKVQAFIQSRTPQEVRYVKGRLVNIVL